MTHEKSVVFGKKSFEEGIQCCVCYNERKFLSPNSPVRNPTTTREKMMRFRGIKIFGDETIIIVTAMLINIM
jgi:hypothetical protein